MSSNPEPNAEIRKLAFKVVSCSLSWIHLPSSISSFLANVTEIILPFLTLTECGERKPTSSHFSSTATETYKKC